MESNKEGQEMNYIVHATQVGKQNNTVIPMIGSLGAPMVGDRIVWDGKTYKVTQVFKLSK
jgi:hypothetical protein